MDPNEALARLRRYADAAVDDAPEDWLDTAPELFQALDSWLSKGGFLPADWQQVDRLEFCDRCDDTHSSRGPHIL